MILIEAAIGRYPIPHVETSEIAVIQRKLSLLERHEWMSLENVQQRWLRATRKRVTNFAIVELMAQLWVNGGLVSFFSVEGFSPHLYCQLAFSQITSATSRASVWRRRRESKPASTSSYLMLLSIRHAIAEPTARWPLALSFKFHLKGDCFTRFVSCKN